MRGGQAAWQAGHSTAGSVVGPSTGWEMDAHKRCREGAQQLEVRLRGHMPTYKRMAWQGQRTHMAWQRHVLLTPHAPLPATSIHPHPPAPARPGAPSPLCEPGNPPHTPPPQRPAPPPGVCVWGGVGCVWGGGLVPWQGVAKCEVRRVRHGSLAKEQAGGGRLHV